MKFNRILLLLPHEDDEVFCAGSIYKFIKQGAKVSAQVMSIKAGIDVRIQPNGEYKEYSSSVRHKEFKKSMDLLGVQDVHEPYYVDDNVQHRLDRIPKVELVMKIEKTIKACRPDTLILPAPSYDQDHVALYEAVEAVMRPHYFAGNVLSYSIFREKNFRPTLFVPLTKEEAQVRIESARIYATQQSSALHLVSPETQENAMHYFGRMIFTDYAEAFEGNRMVYP